MFQIKSLLSFRSFKQQATSFPGFSPTRPTERGRSSVGRVGENRGNEVEQQEDFLIFLIVVS